MEPQDPRLESLTCLLSRESKTTGYCLRNGKSQHSVNPHVCCKTDEAVAFCEGFVRVQLAAEIFFFVGSALSSPYVQPICLALRIFTLLRQDLLWASGNPIPTKEMLVAQGHVCLFPWSARVPQNAGKMFPALGFDVHSQNVVSSWKDPDNGNDLADRLADWLADW